MLTKRLQEIADELLAANKGIKVYAQVAEETTYMFVTNGKTILYLQDDGKFGGISVCLEYKPDHNNGSGGRVAEEDVLDKKSTINGQKVIDLLNEFTNDMSLTTLRKYNQFINPCVEFYKDEDDWYENLYNKSRYEILK